MDNASRDHNIYLFMVENLGVICVMVNRRSRGARYRDCVQYRPTWKPSVT